jgi:pimeloyl-ACP methyl ester carboxylesterase
MEALTVSVRPKNRTNVRTEPLKLQAVRAGLGVLARMSPAATAAIAERLFLTPRKHARPAAEAQMLQRARSFWLPSEFGPLAAWEWGHRGPRVLLVHGWEGRGSQLSALVNPLLDKGFRVVTFDAPGHGDSPGDRSSYFHFARSIEQVAEALGPLHAIVTHSMGGASTLWASRHGPLAERLVLISPPIDLRDFTRQFCGFLGLPESVRERMHWRLDARFGVPIDEVRAEALASRMGGPLLVVHDEADRDVPIACGEAIVNQWPGSELLRTRGLGHRRILRDEQVLQAVTQFVTRQRC